MKSPGEPRDTERRAVEAYRDRFGEEPEVVASAPGRVNLIGEHTDYNGGFALPCAIERRVAVACGKAASPEDAVLLSADFESEVALQSGDDPKTTGWAAYPKGVAWSLGQDGMDVPPFRAAFSGDVPRGSGLSSSAAIESATVLALDALCGFGLESRRRDAALICQRAENEYVGMNSGILDQYASLLCERGSALFIDCRSLDAKTVPLDLESAGLKLLIMDTQISGGLVTTAYGDRRASCESAAERLGVEFLRDAAEEDLDRLDGEDLKRARHIVTENSRVEESVDALESGDFERFGELMYASHYSMRDDFEISTPQHDAFVDLARKRGAIGARLTGGGFRGCAVALVGTDVVDLLMDETFSAFERHGYERPAFYEFEPAGGAEVL